MILSYLPLVLALFCLIYTGHLAIVFHRFNEQIKNWSENLDASTRDAIDRSARQILRDLDEKISAKEAENEEEDEEEEDFDEL